MQKKQHQKSVVIPPQTDATILQPRLLQSAVSPAHLSSSGYNDSLLLHHHQCLDSSVSYLAILPPPADKWTSIKPLAECIQCHPYKIIKPINNCSSAPAARICVVRYQLGSPPVWVEAIGQNRSKFLMEGFPVAVRWSKSQVLEDKVWIISRLSSWL
ncbi:hypothetical protein EYF80_001083 [Liparis tanakae]|uniref:Uncharacterized protein n=1 Tax=Liparis tanakae TaxID=230148 RepID=A0A4Z2JFF3_9TELE|nr:hypothetical protein EYF80_001083 [Liparis tanakae]